MLFFEDIFSPEFMLYSSLYIIVWLRHPAKGETEKCHLLMAASHSRVFPSGQKEVIVFHRVPLPVGVKNFEWSDKFNAYITAQFEGCFPEIYPCLWLYYHSNLNT